MLDWIKNLGKDYPLFWKNYLVKFDSKPKRYVVLAIDSTGFNPKNDVVLSISAIGIQDNVIMINDSFEVSIAQYKFLHDNKLTNDFFADSKQQKMVEADGVEKFIDYLGNSILIGHRINLDIELLNQALEKIKCGRIKNDALDVEVMYKKLHDISDKNFSLEELSTIFKIPINDRISSSDDAYMVALLFLKLKQRLKL